MVSFSSGILLVLQVQRMQQYQHSQKFGSDSVTFIRTNNQQDTLPLSSTFSHEICPNMPFDTDSLQQALTVNDYFHKLGGSLKSVQLFRDSVIDKTLEKLQLQFVPDDSTQNIASSGSSELPFVSSLKQYYAANYDPRGGYGKPLPGHFVHADKIKVENKNNIPELFENRWIEPIEETSGRDKWDASLGPIGPGCPNLIQLGTLESDGYKFYCKSQASNAAGTSELKHSQLQDMAIQEKSSSSIAADAPLADAIREEQQCHILSVGGNDNWKFEVAAADTLGCITHTFDCTLPNNTPKRKPDRGDVRFYPHCLDGRTYTDLHGRSYVTYKDMLQLTGIVVPPTYLKIDVEGFEYDVFSQMIQDDRLRQASSTAGLSTSLLPQQIQVELHWATRMTGVEWMPRTRGAGELALFSALMYAGGGYLPIHQDFNPHCTTCMEVLYYKALC